MSPIHSLLDRIKQGKIISYLPSAVTLLRLTTLPPLIFLMNTGHVFAANSLFLLAVSSDLADGYLARKLDVSSKFGANFDVSTDFLFISGVFLYFTVNEIYPAWVLLIIVAMFAQFLVTSKLKVFFDPVGKYYGSLLYGAIGLTMLFPEKISRDIIIAAFVGVTAASISSRIIYTLRLNEGVCER